MRGCDGAGSTQARTPMCTSPPPLALHPGLDLYGFRVLSNSDRALVLLLVLCTCLACWKLDLSRPEVPVWVWGGSRPLVFFRRCPDWMLPISNNWIWVCKLDLSRPDGCQFGFRGGSRLLVFFRRCPDWLLPISNNWIWVCKLDLSRPDGCQFGFGGGSRPLVFFRRCLDWMLPILNNWIWVCKLDLSRPDECQFGFGGGLRPFVSLPDASNLEQ